MVNGCFAEIPTMSLSVLSKCVDPDSQTFRTYRVVVSDSSTCFYRKQVTIVDNPFDKGKTPKPSPRKPPETPRMFTDEGSTSRSTD